MFVSFVKLTRTCVILGTRGGALHVHFQESSWSFCSVPRSGSTCSVLPMSAAALFCAMDCAFHPSVLSPGPYSLLICLQNPLLRYRLPAIACTPPVQLRLSAIPRNPGSQDGNKDHHLHVVLQWALSPTLATGIEQIVIEISAPVFLETPIKVRSPTAFCEC